MGEGIEVVMFRDFAPKKANICASLARILDVFHSLSHRKRPFVLITHHHEHILLFPVECSRHLLVSSWL